MFFGAKNGDLSFYFYIGQSILINAVLLLRVDKGFHE